MVPGLKVSIDGFEVALADPTENLPATIPEVDAIAGHFPEGGVTRAEGSAADTDFLRRHGADASYLHFACHARGGMIDPGESGIRLADGFVSAHEIGALGGLGGRLTVVSACQSAVADITQMPDEVFSISTALLGIGAACVIASLWPVDDVATAILMTPLYEEMFDNDREPAVALVNAQLWLRQLTEAQEREYLSAYPSLEAELRRRSAAGEPPGRRGVETGSGPGSESIRPYGHPDFWAAFVAVGS
jgi:CHAT domain-containing protein